MFIVKRGAQHTETVFLCTMGTTHPVLTRRRNGKPEVPRGLRFQKTGGGGGGASWNCPSPGSKCAFCNTSGMSVSCGTRS